MSDSFEPFQFLEYARANARVPLLIVASALASAVAISLLLPDRYTATAVMIIEPPGGSDPRISTAVSPVYLESLKTYEQFASSDTLFARACEKFRLLEGGSTPIESLKKQVLEVRKPKETKLLQLWVTLRDPKRAQAVAQFLAEETVALNRRIALDADREAAQRARAEADRAKGERARARADAAASVGLEAALEGEVEALADVPSNIEIQIAGAKGEMAEYQARDNGPGAAAVQARIVALAAERDAATRKLGAKQDRLSKTKAQREEADASLRSSEKDYETAARRSADLDAVAGVRAEQLRIIDPGIVPQKPSSPNLPLNCGVALAGGAMLALVYLAAGFGIGRQRARHVRSAFQVARRGSA